MGNGNSGKVVDISIITAIRIDRRKNDFTYVVAQQGTSVSGTSKNTYQWEKKKGKRKKEERIEERHQLPLFYVRCYIGSYFKQRKLLCQLQFYIIIISRNRPFARKAGERAAVLAKRQPVAPSVLSLANSPGASLYLLSVLLVRPRGHAAGTGAQRAP